ncbi:transposase [Sodalis sp. C49]|uniref:transposase n=1 Tax=Sodalis sp. C49 TaxID=3228929 RepID=UPI0039659F01
MALTAKGTLSNRYLHHHRARRGGQRLTSHSFAKRAALLVPPTGNALIRYHRAYRYAFRLFR